MITFCLISCGEETETDCLKAIEPFKDKIILQEVRNVFPQVKALNQMIEQVQTDWLVPLDADIVLNENAYDRITRAIDKFSLDPNWHTILFKLYDTLTEKEILALKLFRVSILKQFPFSDTATPDVEHFKRLTNAGYKCIDQLLVKNPIGKHIVRGKHFCYNKYKDIYQTLRVHGWVWDNGVFMGGTTIIEKAQKHIEFFLVKYVLTNNLDYIWCIGGILDGLLSKIENKSKSLSNKTYMFNTKKEVLDALWDWQYKHYKEYVHFPFF